MSELQPSDKNIVFGYINQIQTLLYSQNSNNAYFHIIKPLKELCLLYFTFKIDTTILTNNEILNFRKLLQKYNKIHLLNNFEWNLIYKASRDGLSEEIAKEKYENKRNIIFFIESQNGNVLGGYTEKGWSSTNWVYNEDKKAFLFGIRSNKGYEPVISEIKPEQAHRAVLTYENHYLVFGEALNVFVHGNGRVFNACEFIWNMSYTPLPRYCHLLGGKQASKVKDIEIFQLQ